MKERIEKYTKDLERIRNESGSLISNSFRKGNEQEAWQTGGFLSCMDTVIRSLNYMLKTDSSQVKSRAIKFRAWDTKEKCWVGGFSLHNTGAFNDLLRVELKPNNTLKVVGHWEEVPDHILLEQYTGFKDARHVEIYDGDILDDILIVFYSEKNGAFMAKTEDEDIVNLLSRFDIGMRCVTGNIHEKERSAR